MIRRTTSLLLRVFVLLILLQSSVFANSEGRELVLVSSEEVLLDPLSTTTLRRLFLGLKDSSLPHVTAVGNRSDRVLYEVFLQKVVFMSSRNYERHLLTKVFRTGNQRMSVAETQDEVAKALHTMPGSVSFMWAKQAKTQNGIRIIQTIWKGYAD